MGNPTTIDLDLPDETATAALAQRIADVLRPGDTILLSGEIGAGKTAFARAAIRHRVGAQIDVPSPTFTLVQTYDADGSEIWHCDLYRLTDPQEMIELGLDDAFETAICLIEWPERMAGLIPAGALHLRFVAGETGHSVCISLPGSWPDRLALADA